MCTMNTPAILLVQRFAGIDGLGAYLDGAKKTELSRTGNKFRLGPGLCERLDLPRAPVWRSWVNDLDGCALTLPVLRRVPELREAVARRIWAMVPCLVCVRDPPERPTPKDLTGRVGCEECGGTGTQDARRLWERLRREKVPEGFVERGSMWAFLQSRQLQLKPVTGDKTWNSDGFKPELDPKAERGEVYACGWAPGPMNSRWTFPSRLVNCNTGVPALISQSPAHLVLPDAAATWLYLQSRNTMQKPVTVLESGAWEVHGFRFEYDPTQKSGNTHARGYQNPRWTLASSLLSAPEASLGTISRLPASEVLPGRPLPTHDELGRRVVVVLYDDPPYKGQHGKKDSTGYAHESDRAKMWEGARAWRDACAAVGIEFRYGLSEMVCCQEEVLKELELPTNAAPMNTSRKSTFWAKGGGSEWLTTAKHYAPF